MVILAVAIPLLPPCWTRRQAPSLRAFSRPGPLPLNSHWHLRTSESCCCGACGSLSRSLPLSAAAVVARTSSGITSLHAPVPACYAPEVPHLSVLPLVSAVKLVLLLQLTSWCGTSMSHPAGKMTAASRSWQTACRSGEGSKSQSTPPFCRP